MSKEKNTQNLDAESQDQVPLEQEALEQEALEQENPAAESPMSEELEQEQVEVEDEEKSTQQSALKSARGMSLVLFILLGTALLFQDYWKPMWDDVLIGTIGAPDEENSYLLLDDWNVEKNRVQQQLASLKVFVEKNENQNVNIKNKLDAETENTQKILGGTAVEMTNLQQDLADLQNQYSTQQSLINSLNEKSVEVESPATTYQRQQLADFALNISKTEHKIDRLQKEVIVIEQHQTLLKYYQTLNLAFSHLRGQMLSGKEYQTAIGTFQSHIKPADQDTLKPFLEAIRRASQNISEEEWIRRAQALLETDPSEVSLGRYIEPSEENIAETPALRWVKRITEQLGSLIRIRKLSKPSDDPEKELYATLKAQENLTEKQQAEKAYLLKAIDDSLQAEKAVDHIRAWLLARQAVRFKT